MLSRRQLISSAAVSIGFLGARRLFAAMPSTQPAFSAGYGPLIPDPAGQIDLPAGFSYHIFSRTGQVMDDTLRVPGMHDGMAAFAGPDGSTLLVRNHELSADLGANDAFGVNKELLSRISPGKFYDFGYGKGCPGGTTTLVYNTRERMLERHFLSLAGTLRNCAGGPTPWGSWVTCEETVVRANSKDYEKDHGYNFEVPATAEISLAEPVALRAMGRFNHEAIAVDANSGIVYQTEDRHEGLIYRYIPVEKGNLAAGGRLQALRARDKKSLDTRSWEAARTMEPGEAIVVDWVDMEDIDSPTDELRLWGFYAKGCARFARGEGMWTGADGIYFACTNGGTRKQGQIFRYTPSPHEGTDAEREHPGKLELFIEPNDSDLMQNADNLTISPAGHVVFSEDGAGDNFLRGITPGGEIYTIARNAMNNSELAGCCFSPDGTTLFVNIQNPGLTVAIFGPWGS
ncbi:MAG TPA: DUF839 domain-containing protein [Tepidisphaeraceae bacterium]|nr:DUF839 domain-containing protein [Tepidisphaeraceae bacterium]